MKVKVIKNFPVPKCLTDYKLANQLSEFELDFKHSMEPLKPLFSGKNIYVYNAKLEEALDEVKKILCGPQVLKRLDLAKQTVLLTDASKKGLGYVLIQPQTTTEEANEEEVLQGTVRHILKRIPKGKLITCGSRFLSKAEKNYAMSEQGLLVLQWATNEPSVYLVGSQFTTTIDHLYLLSIVNGKNLDAHTNSRIQRILAKLIIHYFKLFWTNGKC